MRQHFIVADFRSRCAVKNSKSAFFQHTGDVFVFIEVQNEIVAYTAYDFAVFDSRQNKSFDKTLISTPKFANSQSIRVRLLS